MYSDTANFSYPWKDRFLGRLWQSEEQPYIIVLQTAFAQFSVLIESHVQVQIRQ
jgi:hypothetical protein